jgi:hypothetical protein
MRRPRHPPPGGYTAHNLYRGDRLPPDTITEDIDRLLAEDFIASADAW